MNVFGLCFRSAEKGERERKRKILCPKRGVDLGCALTFSRASANERHQNKDNGRSVHLLQSKRKNCAERESKGGSG